MKKDNASDQRTEEMRRLEAIFQHSQDGIITIGARGLIESINPAAAQLFGYTPEEVIGHNIKILMPEPYHSEHDGYIQNYHGTGKKKIIGIGREVKDRRKDGATFPFFLSVSEVKLDDQTIFTGFIHDISEIRSKEKELAESRNRLKAIFDTVIDGIIIINARGHIRMVNPAVTTLFGYSAEEMLEQNVKMLMPEPHQSEHDQYLDNYTKPEKRKSSVSVGRCKVNAKMVAYFPLA